MNFFSPTLGLINLNANHNTNIYYKPVLLSNAENVAKKVVLTFAYKSLKKPIKQNKKITKKLLLNLFDEWFCLPESEDFDVDVYNVKTGEHSVEKAKAIKLFLTEAKKQTYLNGFIQIYVKNSKEINDFILKNKLNNDNDDELIYKYQRLYYYFLVIVKIIMDKTINNDAVKTLKVSYKKNDFHFKVDIEEYKLKEHSDILDKDYNNFKDYLFNYYATDLSKKILCENIVPELFLNLGYINDEFIKNDPQILDISCYRLYFND